MSRVRVIDDSTGTELVALADRISEQGWGLASYAAGSLEGWWTPPTPRADAIERPQADGAFAPASLLVKARVLTLVIHHDSSTALLERRAREQIAVLSRGWVRVVVEEEGRTSHVRGFVSERVKLTHRSGTRSTWSLILTCPDPLKYEGEGNNVDDDTLSQWRSSEGVWSRESSGGLLFNAGVFDQSPRDDVTTGDDALALFTGGGTTSLLVENPGTAGTWPVLEVVGPVSWARWSLGDQVVEWSDDVPAGYMLRINAQDGMVTIGGARVAQTGLTRDAFFPLPPGQSVISVEADRPAQMRVRWLPAWT
ncbi:hypothetical protein [Actinomyces radicidentis]|uniref:hypothetical protein n=1 Tax=Actinomyces radicidentis TaxID=111015 RepID=UPI0028ECD4D9|nr:hypothetical protein [Actinomyces radicidentis]